MSWDLKLDKASWFFGPGWGQCSVDCGVHAHALVGSVSWSWRWTNSQQRKIVSLSLRVERPKLKGDKSFVPEPRESSVSCVFWIPMHINILWTYVHFTNPYHGYVTKIVRSKKLLRQLKKKNEKLENNKDSVLFNQTGLNEKMVPKYTYFKNTHTQVCIYIYIYIYGPFSWGCRIHRLQWCKTLSTSVLHKTLNLMVRLQLCWSFRECKVPL